MKDVALPTKDVALTDKRKDLCIFLPEDVASNFSAAFFDEEACRLWILRRLHPSGAHCPSCRAELQGDVTLRRFWSAGRLKCPKPGCKKYFTALTGTFLSGCHLTFRQLYGLFLFLHFNLSARYIAGAVGITPESVHLWRRKTWDLKRT